MAEYIEKEVLKKTIQAKCDELMQKEIFQGLYEKVYCDTIDDCFSAFTEIIDNVPYFVEGELETTLEIN